MTMPKPAEAVSLVVSAAAAVLGAALLAGHPFSWVSGWRGPLGPMRLEGDALSGAFLLLVGLVGMGSCWAALRHREPARVAVLLPAFLVGLAAVPLARDTFTLLAAWETMSLAPGIMLLLDPQAATRRAALLYLAYSQVSALAILSGLLLAPAGAGASGWTGAPLPGGFAPSALLVLLGLAVKAGLMPFHAWLPEAHPVAPAHVSALMSGCMVAMPAYLLLRLLAPHGVAAPVALVLLLLAGLSAALGALHALHLRSLKRVLAMTTVSHMGTLFVVLAVSLLLAGRHDMALAPAFAAAAAGYAMAHGLAKGALFLVSGVVHHATGETDLERLGGLWRASGPMAACALLGGLGLAALPPLAGLPAEVSVLSTLLAALGRLDPMAGAILLGALFLLAVAAGAGLAAVSKVVLGAFHGPPRAVTPPIARAEAVAPGFLVAVALLVGLLPGLLWGLLPGGDGHPVAHAALLPTPLGSTSALGVIAAAGILAVAVGLAAARKPRAIPVDPWNCGAPPPSPRQTYTPQGLVMPYRILFAEILRPGSDLRLQDAPIAPLAPHKGRYVDPEPSFIEPWLHQPLLAFLTPKLEALRRVHRGPVQAYLLVALLVLVAILLLLPVVL